MSIGVRQKYVCKENNDRRMRFTRLENGRNNLKHYVKYQIFVMRSISCSFLFRYEEQEKRIFIIENQLKKMFVYFLILLIVENLSNSRL